VQTNGAAAPVFVDVFSPAGTLLQTIPMPTTAGSNPLTTTVNATTEGMLSRSANFRYIALPGYAAPAGSAAVAGVSGTPASSNFARAVGVLDIQAGTQSTNTTHTIAGTVSVTTRSTAIDNSGTTVWTGSSSTSTSNSLLAQNVGTSTATQILAAGVNLRNVRTIDSQLYFSTGSGASPRISAVGSGLPTTAGQTVTNLTGVSGTESIYGYFAADLDPGVAGIDTLYYVFDGTGGLLNKLSLVAGTWTPNGTLNVGSNPRGLDGYVSGNTVGLFITRNNNELVSVFDSTGYNTTIPGTTPVNLLGTAATNTVFRGVAYIPEPATVAALGSLALLSLRRRRA
jgi:hypothetical protein